MFFHLDIANANSQTPPPKHCRRSPHSLTLILLAGLCVNKRYMVGTTLIPLKRVCRNRNNLNHSLHSCENPTGQHIHCGYQKNG